MFHQEVGDRVLPVTIGHADGRPSHVEMEQDQPAAGRAAKDLRSLAASLGVPLRSRDRSRAMPGDVHRRCSSARSDPRSGKPDRIRPDAAALFAVLKSVNGEGCNVFSLDPRRPEAVAYTRFFNPTVGISEDPATGTAAGPKPLIWSPMALRHADGSASSRARPPDARASSMSMFRLAWSRYQSRGRGGQRPADPLNEPDWPNACRRHYGRSAEMLANELDDRRALAAIDVEIRIVDDEAQASTTANAKRGPARQLGGVATYTDRGVHRFPW